MTSLRYLLLYAASQAFFVALWTTVLAPYLKTIGVDPLLFGIIGSFQSFAGLIGTFASNIVTKIVSIRKLLLMTSVISGLVLLPIAMVRNIVFLISMLTMYSFVASINFIVSEVVLSYIVPEKEYDRAYSLFYVSTLLTDAAGAYLAFLPEFLAHTTGLPLVDLYGYTVSLCGLGIALSSLFILKISVEYRTKSIGTEYSIVKGFLWVFRTLGILLMAETFIDFGAGLSIANINYYFILKYGVGSSELGILRGTQTILMALLMLSMPRISRVLGGSLRTYVLISSTSIPLLIVLTFVNSYWCAMAIYIARTILMNAASPLFTAFLARQSPPEFRTATFSVFSIVRRIVAIPARTIGGYLLSIDLELPLRITAGLYATALTIIGIRYWRT